MDQRTETISPTFYRQFAVGVPPGSALVGLAVLYAASAAGWAFETVVVVLACVALVLVPTHLIAVRKAKGFVDDSEEPDGWFRIVARMCRDALAAVGAGVLIAAVAGCAPADDAATAASEPSTWSLDQASAVALGTDEDFFDRVRGVVRLPDGVTAVADDGLRKVRAFDAAGRLLWTFGREGDGPGEFRSLGGLWMASDSTLGVWDGASRRITYVDTGGALVDVRPIDASAGDVMGPNVEVFLGGFPDGAVLLASLEFGDPPEAVKAAVADRWSVGRFDAQGAFEGVVARLDGMRRVGRNPTPFTQIPVVVVHGDSVLTIDGDGSTFAVFTRESGAAAGALEIALAERSDPPTRAELRDALERSGRDLHLPVLADLDDRWLAERPAVAGALSDPGGTVWVRSFEGLDDSLWLKRDALRPAPGGAWAAYDRKGRKVADIAVPPDFVPFAVAADAVAGVMIDELGVQRVTVMPLTRGR